MNIVVIIPARLKSTRFPRKPLTEIMGKSMIQRTYEQCLKAFSADKIYVATDSEEIMQHGREKGMQVIMTSENCLTGTDRVAEVANIVDADYYINVQGDEPLINPQDILDVANMVPNCIGSVINGYAPIIDAEMWMSHSVPKVVIREDKRLLYMSRSPIPGNKDMEFVQAYRQVCVYAYPKQALDAFAGRDKKTPLEQIEDLEMLRFLEMGYEVQMVELSQDSIAVDHPEDVEKVIKRINGEG